MSVPVLSLIPSKKAFVMLFVATLTSACVIHSGDGATSLYGDLSVSAGKQVSAVTSISGNIDIAERAIIGAITNTSGQIQLGEHVSAGSINNVSGDIRIGEHFVGQDDINLVDGIIDIAAHGELDGSIHSVSGQINVDSSVIKGSIETVGASVSLTGNTHIQGDIVFRKAKGKHKASLTLGEAVVVEGEIKLEQPVLLELATAAQQAKVNRIYAK